VTLDRGGDVHCLHGDNRVKGAPSGRRKRSGKPDPGPGRRREGVRANEGLTGAWAPGANALAQGTAPDPCPLPAVNKRGASVLQPPTVVTPPVQRFPGGWTPTLRTALAGRATVASEPFGTVLTSSVAAWRATGQALLIQRAPIAVMVGAGTLAAT